ncbi:MAG TPA: glycine cleavage system protein GcvH [Candidatus Tenderia sp.]|nr:glycine cleavage system protein GcvH [Candidatus Tenderia sp.]
MAEIPSHLKFSRSHEWVEVLDDGTARVGITDHAQELLGDMVFIEVPECGSEVSAGDECAVVESVKAASDVYSPVSGEVVEVNEELADSPDLVNHHPYGDGWLYRVKLSDDAELDDLLDGDGYAELVADEDH